MARLKPLIHIDAMQRGFTAGRSTTGAIFLLRQLQEKFMEKNKRMWRRQVRIPVEFIEGTPTEDYYESLHSNTRRLLIIDDQIQKALVDKTTSKLNTMLDRITETYRLFCWCRTYLKGSAHYQPQLELHPAIQVTARSIAGCHSPAANCTPTSRQFCKTHSTAQRRKLTSTCLST